MKLPTFSLFSNCGVYILMLFFLFGCTSNNVNAITSCEECNDKLVLGNEQVDLYVPFLKGKRIALVVNHASVIGDRHLCDELIARNVNVVKIFAPEHGFRGDADAGELLKDNIDKSTGLPVISLYGNNKRPTAVQLSDVDVVVYDLQDVGVRFYTYISTLHYVMDACAEYGKTLVVLDRPNPNGDYIDGPILKSDCKSFVGMDPLPIVYALTPGELAAMINGERWLESRKNCDLKVVRMLNYSHDMNIDVAIAPSPNLRNQHAVRIYPSLCFFEATNVSVGRGTDMPFEVIGAPNSSLGEFSFLPKSGPGAKSPLHMDKLCYGIDMRDVNIDKQIDLSYFLAFHNKMKDSFWKNTKFFDLLAGDKRLREEIEKGISADSIKATWSTELDEFKKMRKKYLLYDSDVDTCKSIAWGDAINTTWVNETYERMSLDERIGQLIWITLDVNPSEASIQKLCSLVEKHHVGGVLFLQTSIYDIRHLVERISSHAKYPLLFSDDAENGLAMKIKDVVGFPKNISLGAIRDSEKLFMMGKSVGKQLRVCGMNINYAPVVDVNTNPENPIIGIRSFGENASRVAECGKAVARGIQSERCIAVAKHFPGHGDTEKDSHLMLPVVAHDRARLDSVELGPFRELVDDGVMGVMSAHLVVPGLDSSRTSSSMSSLMLNDLLRKDMHFNGLIVSDAMNMQGAIVAADGKVPETLALMAGNDVVEFSINVPKAVEDIKAHLVDGSFEAEDFEMKVRKVLAAKQWCGLDTERSIYGAPDVLVNSIENEMFARELFASSITVLDSLNIQMPVSEVIALGKWDGEVSVSADSKTDGCIWVFADDTSLSQCQAKLDALKTARKKVVVVYAGNPYKLKRVKWENYACGVVVAYENVERARMALRSFVFEKRSADGVMPVSVGKYKEGAGFIVGR